MDLLTVELIAGPEVVSVAPCHEGLGAVCMEGNLEGHLLDESVSVQPQDPLRSLSTRFLQQLAQ